MWRWCTNENAAMDRLVLLAAITSTTLGLSLVAQSYNRYVSAATGTVAEFVEQENCEHQPANTNNPTTPVPPVAAVPTPPVPAQKRERASRREREADEERHPHHDKKKKKKKHHHHEDEDDEEMRAVAEQEEDLQDFEDLLPGESYEEHYLRRRKADLDARNRALPISRLGYQGDGSASSKHLYTIKQSYQNTRDLVGPPKEDIARILAPAVATTTTELAVVPEPGASS